MSADSPNFCGVSPGGSEKPPSGTRTEPSPARSTFAALNAAGGMDGRPVQLLQQYYAGDPGPAAAALAAQGAVCRLSRTYTHDVGPGRLAGWVGCHRLLWTQASKICHIGLLHWELQIPSNTPTSFLKAALPVGKFFFSQEYNPAFFRLCFCFSPFGLEVHIWPKPSKFPALSHCVPSSSCVLR